MIPKFRVWDTVKKAMSEVQAVVYTEKKVYPIYFEVVRRYVPFSEAVLMQSTGLFDSRSEPVEIYKDDIVKRTSLIPGGSDMIGVVKMLEGCWVIDDGKQAVPLWTEVDKNEVIGNIHEHPHLVEGGG